MTEALILPDRVRCGMVLTAGARDEAIASARRIEDAGGQVLTHHSLHQTGGAAPIQSMPAPFPRT